MLISFLDRFLIDFYCQLGPPETQKSFKIYWFYRHLWLSDVFKKRSTFDPVWVPNCFHFPSKNLPKSFQKSILKAIVFVDRFWHRFLSMLARFESLSCGHVGYFFSLPKRPSQPVSYTHLTLPTKRIV